MIVSSWFWDQIDSSAGPEGCWPWKGSVRSPQKPYGRVHLENRTLGAHRFALLLAKGPPPRYNDYACHSCDNPRCCNPNHLWWGTAAENDKDCCKKGRKVALHRRLIDRVEAVKLREQGWSYSKLAEKYGVCQASIGKALRPLGKGGQIQPNQHLARARAAVEGDR